MKYRKIEITGNKLPAEIGIGFSGGVDSVVALDYLAKNRNLTIIFVDHVTDGLSHVADFAREMAVKYEAKFEYRKISGTPPKNSHECWWRRERYKIFHSFDIPVVTAHHLDDCVENWIWSSMRGEPSIIPYNNKNVIRPFRTVRKEGIIAWAERKGLKWVEDESNKDTRFTRNFIRHEMIESCLRVNPGLYTMVRNMVLEDTKFVRVSKNFDD